MQGQRSAKGSLPESFGFDHRSTSSDTGIDQQLFWNTMRNPAQNCLSDYISPSSTSDMYLGSTSQEGQSSSVWNIGEAGSSSGQNPVVSHCEQQTEHGWSSLIKPCAGAPSSDPQQYEPAGMLSLDVVAVDLRSNPVANGPLFLPRSGPASSPQDLNVNSSFGMECPNALKSGSSENLRLATASSSSNPFGVPSGGGEADGRPGCSSEGRRISCKRKAFELNVGQSSEGGSSNFFQLPEDSVWHSVPARQHASSSLRISTPSSEDTLVSNPSEQVIPRLGLGVGGVASENHPALSAENTRRNIRLRIASHQQDLMPSNNVFTTGTSVGHLNASSPFSSSRLFPLNNPVELRSPAAVDNSSPQVQPALLRRNLQLARWNRSSSSRPGRSSTFLTTGERDAASPEESNSGSMPREHPVFGPATEMRNSAQNAIGWSLPGGSASSAGNVASTSRNGSSSGVHLSSAPNWVPHRNSPQYSRRLSEIVRRSLLSSIDSEAGGQTNNVSSPPSATSAASQEGAIPSGVGNQGPRLSRSAMLLDRHLDGAFGMHPYSMRTLAAAPEGRSRLVSEIRSVLDLMRRGEGLRFEDVMILDQSVFYGMPDIHDRHRDMRLDIDNMSYEELLALEERIGNVNTGLTEDAILRRLKQRKFVTPIPGQLEAEPCCICQEEYNIGEDLGVLKCGHDFHTGCIKEWLVQKNSCPICKSTALAT